MTKIRVGLYDPTGLWGARVIDALTRSSGIELAFGVYTSGVMLERLLSRPSFSGARLSSLLPGHCFLEGSAEELAALNNGAGHGAEFIATSELNYSERADVLLDLSPGGRGGSRNDDFGRFRGPVIAQHIAQKGTLIAPPRRVQQAGANRFRQAACIVTALAPLLEKLIDEDVLTVRLQVVMQFDEKSTDFLIPERLSAFRFVSNYAKRLERELSTLFSQPAFEVLSVVQYPGLSGYAVTLELETHAQSVELEQLRRRVDSAPHVALAPAGMSGTHPLNLAASAGCRVPPVVVFEDSLEVLEGPLQRSRLRMICALDYQQIAVVPFVDAVRILAGGVKPETAMRQTDCDLGLVPVFAE